MSATITKTPRHELKRAFRPLELLRREFDEMLGRWDSEWGGNWLTSDFKAPCDLSETADAFQLRLDVPGVKPEDIKVEVRGDTVHVRGERKTEKEEQEKTFHRVERQVGKFEEMVRLPGPVDDGKVQAEFKEGVLTITLPKTEAAKTHTVQVQVAHPPAM